MKIIAFSILAASLGSTALYLNTQQPNELSAPLLKPQPVQQAAPPTVSQPAPQVATPQQTVAAPASVIVPRNVVSHSKHTPNVTSDAVPHNTNGGNGAIASEGTAIDNKGHELDSALSRQLGEELSKLAGSYWSEKINSYRTRIDRMMSSDDLSKLNQLRVRWGIAMSDTSAQGMGDGLKMMAEFGKIDIKDDDVVQEDYRNENGAPIRVERKVQITVKDGKADTVIVETKEALTEDQKIRLSQANDGQHGTVKVEVKAMKTDDGETSVSTRMNVGGQDMEQTQMVEMVMNMMVASGDERAVVVKSTKDLAKNYRPQLDALKESVSSDIVGFMGVVADHVMNFMQQHRDQMSGDKVEAFSMNMEKVQKGFTSGELQQGLSMIYNLLGEPLLMLYNGSDIGDLVPASIAAPVPGMKISGTTTLRQSFPNPASSKATIGYTLNEASSATVLRLYDASGKVVGTYDQGAQSAGEHNATLDLSAVTPGTYLYHLTVQTPKGEQVFSKTLQVAR